MTTGTDFFQSIKERKAQIDKEIKEYGSTALREVFAEIFEKYPEIEAIRWEQYTPYFNDGDECVFSVGEPRIKPVEKFEALDDAGDWGDGFYESYDFREGYYDKTVAPTYSKDYRGNMVARYPYKYRPSFEGAEVFVDAMSDIADLLRGENDVYKTVFGDHIRITATRDGFDIEDYQHD